MLFPTCPEAILSSKVTNPEAFSSQKSAKTFSCHRYFLSKQLIYVQEGNIEPKLLDFFFNNFWFVYAGLASFSFTGRWWSDGVTYTRAFSKTFCVDAKNEGALKEQQTFLLHPCTHNFGIWGRGFYIIYFDDLYKKLEFMMHSNWLTAQTFSFFFSKDNGYSRRQTVIVCKGRVQILLFFFS